MLRILIFTVFCVLTLNVNAQSDQYSSKVKTMLSLTGAVQTFSLAIDQMIDQMKGMRTDVSVETWDELKTEFKKTSIDDLVELLAPVYFKYLNEADIDGIIAFYNTPIGKKYAENTPAITQESMMVGQEWGMKIGQSIAVKLQEKGY